MENEITIVKSDLFNYTYYDDNHKLIAILNKDKIREILGVDEILLEEEFE